MERAEAKGLGIAVAGHVAVLAALTYSLRPTEDPPPPPPSVEVSFIEEVGPQAAAPIPATEPPAASVAPTEGPPEEAAPAPEPLPAPPELAPAPPEPLPQPRQAVPPPLRPQPRPEPRRAQPQQAAPAPRPAPPPRPAPSGARPSPSRPAPPATRPAQRSGTQTAERTRGSRLGPDLLRGIGSDPSPSRTQSPPAAAMSRQAAADIASVIARQVQPCADRQVHPGPGAERIVTPIILRLNRDGSLVGRPRVGTQSGLDDENRRYADRVADLAIRSFVECAPLRGLPSELYAVPNGWQNFTLRYRLPG